MNLLFDKLKFWRKWERQKPIQEASSNAAVTPQNLKQFIVKAVGLSTAGSSSGRSTDFESPDYDLSEIKTACETDSYINQAMLKYSQLIFKAGYNLTSKNDNAVAYIQQRLRMMSFATGKPVDILLQEIGDDMVQYSNAFLAKSRVDSIMGGIQAKGVLDAKPIGGYFRMDPSTIAVKRDSGGTPTNYKQTVNSTEKTFKYTDIVHMYLDREAGAAFGKPRSSAAIEDVKLLRRLEGNVVSLIYRFAIPLYQVKIGIPEAGLMASEKEVDDAKYEFEKMSLDGMIITNERTDIKAIGAEGEALDATGYLNYFEKRVFTALNVSEAMMGRGGAKQDADSMEAQVHDTVKHIQRTISIFVENMIFMELLMEGGYNPLVNEDDMVHMEFNEINLETKIKAENHAMTKFQGNVIPFEEARVEIGQRADNVDEGRLFANMVQQKNTMEQIDAKNQTSIEIANIAAGAAAAKSAATGSNGAGNTKPKTPAASGTVASRNNPVNQHGARGGPKVKESATTEENRQKWQKNFSPMYKKYQDVRNDYVRQPENAAFILSSGKDAVKREVANSIEFSFRYGVDQSYRDAGQYTPMQTEQHHLEVIVAEANNTVDTLFNDLAAKAGKAETPEAAGLVFDTLEYRLRFLSEYIAPKAYWYGYMKGCSSLGIDQVEIEFNSEQDQHEHKTVVNPMKFSIGDIPAYHAYCSCKVVLRKSGENN